MGSRVCICTLCGIPASGKSSFCERLVHDLGNDYLVIHVNYDNVLLSSTTDKIQLHQSLLHENQDKTEDGLFKASRHQVLKLVGIIIQNVISHGPPTDFKALDGLDNINRDIRDSFLHSCRNDLSSNPKYIKDVLLLIDDNLYLTSMRYDFYKLAKQYETGFCEIFMDSSVKTALDRNRTRKGQSFVSEDVICKMQQKLEPPDLVKNHWEKYSIKVTTEEMINIVFPVIQTAFANPAQPVCQVDEKEQALSQTVCSKSIIHQADLILRKCVATSIATGKKHSKDVKLLSKQAMEVKEFVLNALKNGHLSIPCDESNIKDASRDETCDFYKFIFKIFDEKLKVMT